jgi:hypothetical protein
VQFEALLFRVVGGSFWGLARTQIGITNGHKMLLAWLRTEVSLRRGKTGKEKKESTAALF